MRVYQNRDFISELSDKGSAVRSLVYLDSGIVTVSYWKMGKECAHETQKQFAASDLPETRLREKYIRLAADGLPATK